MLSAAEVDKDISEVDDGSSNQSIQSILDPNYKYSPRSLKTMQKLQVVNSTFEQLASPCIQACLHQSTAFEDNELSLSEDPVVKTAFFFYQQQMTRKASLSIDYDSKLSVKPSLKKLLNSSKNANSPKNSNSA